jgi:8-oxo-dGTP pyrophosphatase MutT (NUDIX family)
LPRDPVPTWSYVFAVVQKDDRFLLVQETKHGRSWYLPAGRVEPHESLVAAVHRETLEEAGVPIVLEGLLRVERTVRAGNGVRLRVFFAARPADDTPPKSVADAESLGAGWFTLAEAARLPLRGDDVLESLELRLAARRGDAGAVLAPLTLLAEG